MLPAYLQFLDGPSGPAYDLLEFGRHAFSAGGPYLITKKVFPRSDPPVVKWFKTQVGDNAFLGHWCVLLQGAGLEGNCGTVDMCVVAQGYTIPAGKNYFGYGVFPFGREGGYGYDPGAAGPAAGWVAWHFFLVCLTAIYANAFYFFTVGCWIFACIGLAGSMTNGGPLEILTVLPASLNTVLTAACFVTVCTFLLGAVLGSLFVVCIVHKWLLLGRVKPGVEAGYSPIGKG
eukprot:SAG22_NODE_969_length_6231_cov_4.839041_3_plen_231_part_00